MGSIKREIGQREYLEKCESWEEDPCQQEDVNYDHRSHQFPPGHYQPITTQNSTL